MDADEVVSADTAGITVSHPGPVTTKVVPWREEYSRAYKRRIIEELVLAALGVVVLGLVLPVLLPADPPIWLAGTTAFLFVGAIAWRLIERTSGFSMYLTCTKCGKRFSTNSPWLCGYCDARNSGAKDDEKSPGRARRWENGDLRWVVDKAKDFFSKPEFSPRAPRTFCEFCSTCEAKVPAYECHFCGHKNVLLPDWDGRHVARHATHPWEPEADETHDQARERRRREQEVTEDRTRLTEAQTRYLRAERDRLIQERRLAELRGEDEEKGEDPVTRYLREQRPLELSLMANAKTREEIKMINLARKKRLQEDVSFQRLSEADQDIILARLDGFTEQHLKELNELA